LEEELRVFRGAERFIDIKTYVRDWKVGAFVPVEYRFQFNSIDRMTERMLVDFSKANYDRNLATHIVSNMSTYFVMNGVSVLNTAAVPGHILESLVTALMIRVSMIRMNSKALLGVFTDNQRIIRTSSTAEMAALWFAEAVDGVFKQMWPIEKLCEWLRGIVADKSLLPVFDEVARYHPVTVKRVHYKNIVAPVVAGISVESKFNGAAFDINLDQRALDETADYLYENGIITDTQYKMMQEMVGDKPIMYKVAGDGADDSGIGESVCDSDIESVVGNDDIEDNNERWVGDRVMSALGGNGVDEGVAVAYKSQLLSVVYAEDFDKLRNCRVQTRLQEAIKRAFIEYLVYTEASFDAAVATLMKHVYVAWDEVNHEPNYQYSKMQNSNLADELVWMHVRGGVVMETIPKVEEPEYMLAVEPVNKRLVPLQRVQGQLVVVRRADGMYYDNGWLLVCKTTKVVVQPGLILGILQAAKMVGTADFAVTFVNGVCGNGKTYEIKNRSKCGHLRVGPNREGMLAMRGALKGVELDVNTFVRTCDSILINPGVQTDVVWFDECVLTHAAVVYAVTLLSNARYVYCYGDSEQIPFINRLNGMEFIEKRIVTTKEVLRNVGRRCNKRITRAMANWSGYRGRKIRTTSEIEGEVEIVKISGIQQVASYVRPGALVLTFTQAEKEMLKARGIHSEVVELPKGGYLTVHESQGLTCKDVVLVRLQRQEMAIMQSAPHALVGCTRSTHSLIYCTVTIKMDSVRKFLSGCDKDPGWDVYISKGDADKLAEFDEI
jgi:hypothetical protein